MQPDTLMVNSVEDFYRRFPFPWFDLTKFNQRSDLIKHASQYARMIYMNIPFGKEIADVGCGTGQLACLLSLKASRVDGIDFSQASIEKAASLRDRLGIRNLDLHVVDILKDLGAWPKRYDVVFCNGVLHHLSDPEAGVVNLCGLLKSGSYVVIGYYNTFGRFIKNVSRKFRVLPDKETQDKQALHWHLDQECHPHEVTFTHGDVMRWFNKCNIEYCSSMPPIEHFHCSTLFTRPFRVTQKQVSLFKRFFVQLSWVWSLRSSGGYSVIVGRKR
ncbi:MAG: class I SAM-dependent methyltransferase [Candidatus Omnitrophica bacterium]|nr:class I SAM-dependent methyltransferase [Candidatus Omnitrophota bacterium]